MGENLYNGYGGKVEQNETIKEAAIRELEEESQVVAKQEDLIEVGIVDFYFPEKPDWNQRVHWYILNKFQNKPVETKEMEKPDWFDINNLPYDQMWPADKQLLPKMLENKFLNATITFNGKGESIKNIEFD